jgi:malate dehydrogenase (oxaloacetate-decarboxylating)(NADP+)
MYVFPGIGLAASVAGVTRITDRMMYRAAAACTDSMNAEEIAEGRTFPHIKRIREVALQVAVAVIDEALKGGLAPKISNKDLSEGISTLVARKMYYPNYVSLVGPRHG